MWALHRTLVDDDLGGWPYDQVTPVPDPVDCRRVISELRRIARNTRGVLLLYFVGHGTISENGDLVLAVTDTSAQEPDITGLEYSKIRSALLDSPARVKIVILDCCYSGRIIPSLAGEEQQLADSADIRGTYTLTAADHIAHAGHPDTSTAFTQELLDLIGTGIAGGPPILTFAELYPHLKHRLAARELPLPNQRGTDTALGFPVVRNVSGKTTVLTPTPIEPASSEPTASPTSTSRTSQSIDPFERSWTGNEPVASYAHRITKISWQILAALSAICAVAAILGIVLALNLDPKQFSSNAQDNVTVPLLFISGCSLLFAYGAYMAKLAARQQERRPWSLHVGPHYIVTTGPAGRREFTWDRVKKVGIGELHSWSPYQFTAIFLGFYQGERPTTIEPAGWLYPKKIIQPHGMRSGKIGPRKSGVLVRPVCILGPLTDKERAHLAAALAAYGRQS